MRLRDLDVSVLDAEQALTAAGHGDLADALTRIEALRARVAGFDALLGEKTRGLQRELASVADEGVFETLVADAAEVRRQLDELGALGSGLQEERAAIERAEYDLAAAQRAFAESAQPERNADDLRMARRDLETRREALARIDAELTRAAARLEQSGHARRCAGGRARRAHRDARTSHRSRCPSSARPPKPRGTRWCVRTEARGAADDALRERRRRRRPLAGAGRDARGRARRQPRRRRARCSRRRARRDRPAGRPPRHRRRTRGRGARGARRRGARGRGRRSGRARARRSNGSPPATPAHSWSSPRPRVRPGRAPPAPSVPGARLLADCVRSAVPGLAAAVERLLDGAVLADGDWSRALDLVLREPSLTVVTERGDRWVAVVRGVWAATPSRPLEPRSTTRARVPRRPTRSAWCVRETLDAASADLDARRRDEAAAADAERRAVHELDGVERARARVQTERTQREVELAAIAAEQEALQTQREADVEGIAALEVRVPVLEADAAEAQSLFESRALVQLELDERATTVAGQRRELDVRAAQLAERRQVLEHRLAEVDDRLARDPERRAEAEQHRVALEQRGLGYHRRRRPARRADRAHRRDVDPLAHRSPGGSRAGGGGQRPAARAAHDARHRRAGAARGARAAAAARDRRSRDPHAARGRGRDAAHRVRRRACGRARRARARGPRRHHPRRPRPRPRPRAAAHGPDQPARARGARRPARTPRVPAGPARGRQGEPARAEPRHQGRRPGDRVGVRSGVRRRAAELHRPLHHAVPRRLGQAPAHRPRRPAQHRHRDGGAPVGQERAPPLAAVRRGALAHRAGVPVRGVPRPARRPST